MEKIKSLLLSKYILIALAVLLIILVIILIARSAKKKKYNKALEAFQVRYNKIKSIPLTMKLNKVSSINVNSDSTQQESAYTEELEKIQNNFKLINVMLGNMEDNILVGNLKEIKNNEIDLEGVLDTAEKQVSNLDRMLTEALEPETKQRDEINTCKEKFRELKLTYSEKSAVYTFAEDCLNDKFKEAEDLFTRFEELMYANDFDKAKESVGEINLIINYLDNVLKKMPDLLTSARGIIPQNIETVENKYNELKVNNVFVGHLDVIKNIETIKESLAQDLNEIKNGEVDKASDHFADYLTRLQQLSDQMTKEEKSVSSVTDISGNAFGKLDQMTALIVEIEESYKNVGERYGFEQIKDELPAIKKKEKELLKLKESISETLDSSTIPSSTVMLTLREFNQNVDSMISKLSEYKTKLSSVMGDEERANKQLLKLHLIMNEIKIKINCYNIPAVSDQCSEDIDKAYEKIGELENILNSKVLDADKLNAVLLDTIDYVYKLYNNVNNIVGMAQMCENTIVFANKYRSTMPDLDSELTRSELLFKNGEYTEALTIAINAVEKLHLDSYETLIKENAASAS